MKRILICILFAAATMAVPAKANAAGFVFTLDCTVQSATTCPIGGGPFGTVTVTDNTTNTNLVDVTVDLTNPLLAQVVSLNWNSAVYGPLPFLAIEGIFTTTGGATILKYQTDASGAFSRFDIALWDNTAPLTDPLTFSIGHTLFNGGNLDAAMFLAKDDQNALYAAVRTGLAPAGTSSNANCATTIPYDCYGALTYAAVPEPGTLGLLGMGLFAIAGAARRKLRKG